VPSFPLRRVQRVWYALCVAQVNAMGFSGIGLLFFPVVGSCARGCRAGVNAALPIAVLVLYIGLTQVALSRLYPAVPRTRRSFFVAAFPLLIALAQRGARKLLRLLPAMKSKRTTQPGRWPKEHVAALATIFYAFAETLNLAVLVAGSSASTSPSAAVLFNLTFRLLTGVTARTCLTWRVKQALSRTIGRSLSCNPAKCLRKLPPAVYGARFGGLKTRNRVSAIFMGNKSTAGYATLLAWLLYAVFGISFNANLAASPCDSLAVMHAARPSGHVLLFGMLLACELLEDALVKLLHAFVLPCVTRRVLAPSWAWLTLQCLCQIIFALTGFESVGSLLRADQLGNHTLT